MLGMPSFSALQDLRTPRASCFSPLQVLPRLRLPCFSALHGLRSLRASCFSSLQDPQRLRASCFLPVQVLQRLHMPCFLAPQDLRSPRAIVFIAITGPAEPSDMPKTTIAGLCRAPEGLHSAVARPAQRVGDPADRHRGSGRSCKSPAGHHSSLARSRSRRTIARYSWALGRRCISSGPLRLCEFSHTVARDAERVGARARLQAAKPGRRSCGGTRGGSTTS
jgi:hypothetical protein